MGRAQLRSKGCPLGNKPPWNIKSTHEWPDVGDDQMVKHMPNISLWPVCLRQGRVPSARIAVDPLPDVCTWHFHPLQPNPSHALLKCPVALQLFLLWVLCLFPSWCRRTDSTFWSPPVTISLTPSAGATWVQIMRIHLHKMGFILLLLGVSSAPMPGWINLFLAKPSKY